jgi:hypothetical protein
MMVDDEGGKATMMETLYEVVAEEEQMRSWMCGRGSTKLSQKVLAPACLVAYPCLST